MELSKILKSKENEIKNKSKDIDNLNQENKDLKENLKVIIHCEILSQYKLFRFSLKYFFMFILIINTNRQMLLFQKSMKSKTLQFIKILIWKIKGTKLNHRNINKILFSNITFIIIFID